MTERRGTSESRNGIRIDWDVAIPMDDGIELQCDIFRPDDKGDYPAIMAAGPYGKWSSLQDDTWIGQWRILCEREPEILRLSSNQYQSYEFCDPERFVPDGYVIIRIDVRGTGRSPGVIDLFSARETKDLYDCIEWAAKQPWSNGKVGLSGVSYLAANQWQVAALQPPSLKALCIWEGFSDLYREFYRHGGIFSKFSDLWIEKYIWPIQNGRGVNGQKSLMNGDWISGPVTLSETELESNRRDWRKDLRANPFATAEFFRSRQVDFSKVNTPLLSSANWGGQGLHLRGNVEGFLAAASKEKWLNFHCLEHWTEFYMSRGIELQKRFFGHFLKGENTGWSAEPRVRMQVRHPEKSPADVSADSWPLPNTQWAKYFLEPRNAMLEPVPSEKEFKVTYDSTSDGITFLTPPLANEIQITGPSAAKLFVSSSTEDADIFLVLRVFTPDLKEVTFPGSNDPHTPMAHGWLRASARKLDRDRSLPYRPYHTHDERQPIEPGKIYKLDIEIWPTCIVVPKGHRVGLTVRGKDYVYPGDLSTGFAKIGQPATGVGPFRHEGEDDRPTRIFNNQITLHFSKDAQPYVLLPLISK